MLGAGAFGLRLALALCPRKEAKMATKKREEAELREELEVRVWDAVEAAGARVPPLTLARWMRALGSDLWRQAREEERGAGMG